MSSPAGDSAEVGETALFTLEQTFSKPWVRSEFEQTLMVNERFIGPENARRLASDGIARYLSNGSFQRLNSLAESHEIGPEVPIFNIARRKEDFTVGEDILYSAPIKGWGVVELELVSIENDKLVIELARGDSLQVSYRAPHIMPTYDFNHFAGLERVGPGRGASPHRLHFVLAAGSLPNPDVNAIAGIRRMFRKLGGDHQVLDSARFWIQDKSQSE